MEGNRYDSTMQGIEETTRDIERRIKNFAGNSAIAGREADAIKESIEMLIRELNAGNEMLSDEVMKRLWDRFSN